MRTCPWLTDTVLEMAYTLVAASHAQIDDVREVIDTALNRVVTSEDGQLGTLEHRAKKDRTPTRLVLVGPPLLQRLLLVSSDEMARREGNAEQCEQSEVRMVARYLQFLVLQALRRSSRWAAAGIGQFVYSYRGSEVGAMVRHLTGEDWNERKRKNTKRALMALLTDRFSGLRRIDVEGAEHSHFQPWAHQEQFKPGIWMLLDILAPWDLGAPGRRNEHRSVMDADWVELDRCRTVVRPDSFGSLVQSLGLAAHTNKLRLPQLVRCDGPGDAPEAGRTGGSTLPAPPNRSEHDAIRQRLARASRRRKTFALNTFEIRVDGAHAGAFTGPGTAPPIALPPEADLIEVFGRDQDGDILLATHMLNYSEEGGLTASTSVVASGLSARFSFAVTVSAAPSGSAAAFCTVSHALTASWAWRRFLSAHVPTAVGRAAAIFLIVSLSAVALLQDRELRSTRANMRLAEANSREREQALQTRVANLEATTAQELEIIHSTGTTAGPEEAAVVPHVLTPGRMRGAEAGTDNVIRLSTRATILALSLPVQAGDFRFAAVLETPEGTALRRFENLTALVRTGGKPFVPLNMTLRGLENGDYVLRLSAIGPGGARESVEDYAFSLTIDESTPGTAAASLFLDNDTGGALAVRLGSQVQTLGAGASTVAIPPGISVVTVRSSKCGTATLQLRPGASGSIRLRCTAR